MGVTSERVPLLVLVVLRWPTSCRTVPARANDPVSANDPRRNLSALAHDQAWATVLRLSLSDRERDLAAAIDLVLVIDHRLNQCRGGPAVGIGPDSFRIVPAMVTGLVTAIVPAIDLANFRIAPGMVTALAGLSDLITEGQSGRIGPIDRTGLTDPIVQIGLTDRIGRTDRIARRIGTFGRAIRTTLVGVGIAPIVGRRGRP